MPVKARDSKPLEMSPPARPSQFFHTLRAGRGGFLCLLSLCIKSTYLGDGGKDRPGIIIDRGIHHFPHIGNGRSALGNPLFLKNLYDTLCPFNIFRRWGIDFMRRLNLARMNKHFSFLTQLTTIAWYVLKSLCILESHKRTINGNTPRSPCSDRIVCPRIKLLISIGGKLHSHVFCIIHRAEDKRID